MVLRLEVLARPSALCRTFEKLAGEVWTTMADAAAYKLSFGEESLTEHLLLELKRGHSSEINIQAFGRREEGRNGADWAWWFEGRRWLGMRVQAKRLYPSGRYEALADKVGKSKTLQIDLLLKEAKKDKLFPMYCFYNFWDVATLPVASVPFNCVSFRRSEHRFGCTLAAAEDVKQHAVARGRDDLATVARLAFPWLCLPCCPQGDSPGYDLAQRVVTALKHQLQRVEEPEFPPRQPPSSGTRPDKDETRRTPKRKVPAVVDNPPQYVLDVKEGQSVADQELPAGVGGVVVFKDVPRERVGEV